MNSVTSFFQGNSALMALMCIYMILAYSQYLFLKAGVFCFSTAGSAAIGAYATGYLSTQGMSSWLTVPLAVVFATTATLILGASLFRVRGISLGIASIAFVLGIVSLLYVIPSVSGGALGLLGISPWATLPVLFVFLVATSLLMWRIDKSEYGMRLDAMRCDEVAAMGIGLGTDNLRLSVFALSGALGGLGGALLAHNAFAIFPTQFSFELMISVLLYAVVGGVRQQELSSCSSSLRRPESLAKYGHMSWDSR